MSTAAVDLSRCPLCGEANACAMVEGGSTCWCFELVIPGEVLARIPAEAQGIACVCRRCAAGQKAAANSE
jgi:hypothetical protein